MRAPGTKDGTRGERHSPWGRRKARSWQRWATAPPRPRARPERRAPVVSRSVPANAPERVGACLCVPVRACACMHVCARAFLCAYVRARGRAMRSRALAPSVWRAHSRLHTL
eukprot:5642689-Pleurochrysis_carterae.AAC.2